MQNKSATCLSIAQHSISQFSLKGTTSNRTQTFGDWVRPHYWYLAVANCPLEAQDFKYTLSWEQPNGSMYSQISFDQWWNPGSYTAFVILYAVLVAVNLYGDFLLFKEKALHPIVRILTISILLMFVGVLCVAIHWWTYDSNGTGVPALNVIGQLMQYSTEIVFMFLLILIAQGWAITTQQLENKWVLLGILSGFTVIYIILFFWQQFGLNPATTTDLYASVPGGILLATRCVTAGYFGFCVFKTLKAATDDKKTFFYIFGACYLVWFISLPIVAAIMTAVAFWYRDGPSNLVDLIITFLAQGGLAFLLWPSRAAKYFTISAPDLLGYKPANSGTYGTL